MTTDSECTFVVKEDANGVPFVQIEPTISGLDISFPLREGTTMAALTWPQQFDRAIDPARAAADHSSRCTLPDRPRVTPSLAFERRLPLARKARR
jgi:hypothetical protein